MESIDLSGRNALIVGVANENSLAAAVARRLRKAGANVALTYHSEKTWRYLRPFAEKIGVDFAVECDVGDRDQVKDLFTQIRSRWHDIDILFHTVGAVPQPDIGGPLIDCSPYGFSEGMRVSCYSFIQLAHDAAPLMRRGGSIQTLTFFGAERVVDHYNVMGPVKAALQSAVQYLAHELGPRGIRVNAISAGPVRTRAASGLTNFQDLLSEVRQKSPLRRTVTANEVAGAALFLASSMASGVTGEILHVDSGHHIEGMVFENDAA